MNTLNAAALLALALSSAASVAQAQMKTAIDFERERDARPAYRIVQQDGKWQIQKPEKPQPKQKKEAAKSLAWTEWELASPRYEGLAKTPWLKFQDDKIGASVGLNGMGGAFKVDGAAIKIGPLFSTKMAGPKPLMDAEREYSAALEGATTWSLSPDGQVLTLSGKGDLRFNLKATTENAWSESGTKLIRVEPTLGPEMDGDKAPKYLQLEDLSAGTSWGRFTAPKIEGFKFEQANQYIVEVAVERNERADPPQRLKLQKIVSQKFLGKITPKDGEVMIEVAPVRIGGADGSPEKFLQVRFFGEGGYGDWQALPTEIEGFTFEEGAKYRLLARKAKEQHPAAASPPSAYKMTRLLEKMPVTL